MILQSTLTMQNHILLYLSTPQTSVIEKLGMTHSRDRGKEPTRGTFGLKAQTSVFVLYFPQTHDLLKDSALSATVASHLKQRNDRLSEEGKLFKGIVWI